MKKKLLGAAVLSGAALLSACHKEAPKKHTQEETIAFLIKASSEASRAIQLSDYKPSHQYFFCMNGNPTKLDCDALFDEMLHVSKNSEDFSALTREDLTNPTAFKVLKEPLEIKLFNTDEEF